MAAASYTTDLTLIHATDAASASWTEPTGFIDGAITLPETDYFIQGTGCLSKTMGAGAAAVSGAIYNAGAGQTIPSGNALFIWLYFGAPNALNTQAAGGLRVFVGSATSAFKQWYVKGANTYTYGGWFCVPVDPNTTQDATTGTPTATLQFFGAAATLNATSAVSKGNPFGIDVLRHGRGEMRINGGDLANGYATFAGFAAQNDAQANRWGLFQTIDGGYLWQGLMVLGFTSAVDFRDSNVSVQIANTQKVVAAFNRIEVRQATSRVDWTGVSISALGTLSKGQFAMINNATVNLTTCTFTDMDTFVFQSGATVSGTTFRRCGQVTLGDATMTGCRFENSTAATSLLVGAAISTVSNCTFVSDGSNHAIQITATGNYTFNGLTFSGYAAANGSTGNETVFVNVASGSVTINTDSAISFRTAGATVTVIAGQKTLTLTGIVAGSDVVILSAGTNTALADNDGATNPVTTFAYSYTFAANTFVDIAVYKVGYVPFVIRNYQLANANGSLPIAQVADRNYTP